MDASAGGGLASILSESTPYGVVLTEPRLDESEFVGQALTAPETAAALADELHRQTMEFLADCRVAIRAMMPAGRGYVLALCIDDYAARILGLGQTPIAKPGSCRGAEVHGQGVRAVGPRLHHVRLPAPRARWWSSRRGGPAATG